MKKTVLIFLLISVAFLGFTQEIEKTINIRGVVGDTIAMTTLPYASIVIKSSDSDTVYAGAITNEYGQFRCKNVQVNNDFEIRISYTGYEPLVKLYKIHKVKNRLFVVAKMKALATQLKEVEVSTSHRTENIAKISVPIDSAMLANVVNTPDMMRKIPEITVNPITQSATIKGKENTFVMLNGVMTSTSVNLRSIDPNTIEKIELINIPSGEFDNNIDAVINVVLVDNSISMNLYTENVWWIGKAFNTYNGVRFMRNKHSFGFDYYFETKPYKMDFNFDRHLKNTNDIYKCDAYSLNSKDINHTIDLHYDYHISKSSVFSLYSSSYFYSADKLFANTVSHTANNELKKEVLSSYHSTPDIINTSTVAFFKTKLNDKGLTLSLNNNLTLNTAKYSRFHTDTIVTFADNYTEQRFYKDDSRYWSNNFVSKLSIPIKKSTWEMGAMVYYKKYDNTHTNYIDKAIDIDYNMLKVAAFTSFSGKIKSWEYQIGAKYENYQYNIYHHAYADFSIQPSLHLLKKQNENKSWQIDYTQKSFFPSLWQIAQQQQARDAFSLSLGNEKLKPMQIHHLSAGRKISKNHNMFQVSLHAKYHNNVIADHYSLINNNILQKMPVNIDGKFKTYINISASYEILTRLTIDADIDLYREHFVQTDDNRVNYSYRGEVTLYSFLPQDLVCGAWYTHQGKTLLAQGNVKASPSANVFVGLRLFGDQGRLSAIYEFYKPTTLQFVDTPDFSQDYEVGTLRKGFWLRFSFYFFKKGKELKDQKFEKYKDLDIK